MLDMYHFQKQKYPVESFTRRYNALIHLSTEMHMALGACLLLHYYHLHKTEYMLGA